MLGSRIFSSSRPSSKSSKGKDQSPQPPLRVLPPPMELLTAHMLKSATGSTVTEHTVGNRAVPGLNNDDGSFVCERGPETGVVSLQSTLIHPATRVPTPVASPGVEYAFRKIHSHRDALGRVWVGNEDDRYISPTDGRLKELIVQATHAVQGGAQNNTWARKKIGSGLPIHLRVITWGLKDWIAGKSLRSRVWLTWVPTHISLLPLLFIPSHLSGEVRNNGHYEEFKYHFWGYPSIPRTPQDAILGSPTAIAGEGVTGVHHRPQRPRYLCFITRDGGMEVKPVSDWEDVHCLGAALQYVFISYTPAQFHGRDDTADLHDMAAAAARLAGVSAYWNACSCMPDEDELSEDMSRMSDVIRGAHSLAVILGPSAIERFTETGMAGMLRQWGERAWSLSELLLSPVDRLVSVYIRDEEFSNPRLVLKRDFPHQAWPDAPAAKQLIDHCEGFVGLSPLELVTLALQCLSPRANDTLGFYPGDMVYVLTGLLQRRLNVNPTNTAFQEVSRLSLAQNDNRIIERISCLLPRHGDQPWHHIEDAWKRNLWDISPLCQVDAVGEDDTVILGGGFAAPIRWGKFHTVNLGLQNNTQRMVIRFTFRSIPLWYILAVLFVTFPGLRIVAYSIFGCAALMTLFAASFLRGIYLGQASRPQPWLFGFEGYMTIDKIETLIFGCNIGRLRWSPSSSILSRHISQDGEYLGVDPITDPAVKDLVKRSRQSQYAEDKVFTLVDTNLMTVTLFSAVRPPVALVICGSEGGMQRGLLCSYDWKNQTLYRETVVRVDSMALERMSRVDRFRLGLKRPLPETVLAPCKGSKGKRKTEVSQV
ncbi:hypothetical protein BJX99DRAFT_243989 [Aspergillus californicus]